jgi:WD40 repeat protein
VISNSSDGTLRVWDTDTGTCLDILEAMEVSVSGMDFSRALITEDLAGLLYHNGAIISELDYLRWADVNHIPVDKEPH